jgi:hypothetical protein
VSRRKLAKNKGVSDGDLSLEQIGALIEEQARIFSDSGRKRLGAALKSGGYFNRVQDRKEVSHGEFQAFCSKHSGKDERTCQEWAYMAAALLDMEPEEARRVADLDSIRAALRACREFRNRDNWLEKALSGKASKASTMTVVQPKTAEAIAEKTTFMVPVVVEVPPPPTLIDRPSLRTAFVDKERAQEFTKTARMLVDIGVKMEKLEQMDTTQATKVDMALILLHKFRDEFGRFGTEVETQTVDESAGQQEERPLLRLESESEQGKKSGGVST